MNGSYFSYRNMTKICEVPEVPDASYGWVTWITSKRDESRTDSAEMKVLPSVKRWGKTRRETKSRNNTGRGNTLGFTTENKNQAEHLDGMGPASPQKLTQLQIQK
jgi:hypothetical protein